MATYEPIPREYHISALVASKVLVYSGRTQDESVQSRERLQSVVEVYDPHTEQWEAQQCTGKVPVQGLYNTAHTTASASSDVLYTYGGRDGNRKFVNSLHQLNFKTNSWSIRSPRNDNGGLPMPKCGTAMAACGNDLALLGGFGLLRHPKSSFMKKYTHAATSGWTNEFHIYDLKEGMQ